MIEWIDTLVEEKKLYLKHKLLNQWLTAAEKNTLLYLHWNSGDLPEVVAQIRDTLQNIESILADMRNDLSSIEMVMADELPLIRAAIEAL